MKQFITLLALLISAPSFAHVKLGEYKGATAEGKPCSFTATQVSFIDQLHHPLNERVAITVDGKEFTLQHSPIVDAEEGSILFDHDHLTGTKGTPSGALGFVLKMEHEEGKEGPSGFVLITHDYGNAKNSSKLVCGNLVQP